MLGSYGGDYLLYPLVKVFRTLYTADFNRLKENMNAAVRKNRKKKDTKRWLTQTEDREEVAVEHNPYGNRGLQCVAQPCLS
jgi:hypothetical protein